jgi:hypothetical protein
VNEWDVYYQKAILDDGSPFFPEKLPLEALETIKRTQGSYMFANQYMNEIIPDENRRFKKAWFKYYTSIPNRRDTVVFIDPNSMEDDKTKNKDHDFIGTAVVHGDEELRWYVEWAHRLKLSPTELVNLVFDLNERFKPRLIGVEDVFYQKMLCHLLWEEYKLRKIANPNLAPLPIVPVKPPTDKSKERKIETVLVPRLEWGRIFFNQGLHDFEHELLTFPRGAFDDIIDAVASCDEIMSYPVKENPKHVRPHPGTAAYEKAYIAELAKNSS